MLALFEQQAPMASGTANELNPRALPLSDTAIRIWWEFADHIEARLAPDRELALVSGFANKLPEHAARLAGVLHVVEGLNDAEISERAVNAGIVLSQYYLEQTLGLFAGPLYSPLLIEADRLWLWLRTKWCQGEISLPDIYQLGPNFVRSKDKARELVDILEDQERLERFEQSAQVNGQRRREVWRIAKTE